MYDRRLRFPKRLRGSIVSHSKCKYEYCCDIPSDSSWNLVREKYSWFKVECWIHYSPLELVDNMTYTIEDFVLILEPWSLMYMYSDGNLICFTATEAANLLGCSVHKLADIAASQHLEKINKQIYMEILNPS